MGKELTEGDVEKLYHALTGTPPARELSEAQIGNQLKRQCLYELEMAKEQELVEQLARARGLPVSPSISEGDLSNLFEALS